MKNKNLVCMAKLPIRRTRIINKNTPLLRDQRSIDISNTPKIPDCSLVNYCTKCMGSSYFKFFFTESETAAVLFGFHCAFFRSGNPVKNRCRTA